ncbi:MAG: hypothetical protein ACI9FB_000131 [Candidatus Azotimanducaceae bacterium]|jgi:uncharacterized protein (DUF58 family)
MMLAAINYQNSLIFALAFLLLSMFMVSILHTFRNLSGLTIHRGHTLPAFAGEDVEFNIRLSRGGVRTYEALVLGWDPDLMQGADLLNDDYEQTVKLYVQTKKRGVFKPGRLLIQTFYPVGLFRAWSWLDLGVSTIVYPRPVPGGAMPDSSTKSDDGVISLSRGVDDFHGMRDYHEGDSLRHISWKSYARTDELLVKEFAANVDQRTWLDWDQYQGVEKELRLSHLCHWVIELSKGTHSYGLRLPGLEFLPDNGLEHRAKVLHALATFDLEFTEL